MPAAEYIERQVAVTGDRRGRTGPPMAVKRIVGRVEVEDDLSGRPCMRLQEEIDQQGSIAAPSWLILW